MAGKKAVSVKSAMSSRSKKGGKGKKKKGRGKLRKINLDLFGLLTFTRIFGASFESFMYSGEKKTKKGGSKSKSQSKSASRKGKKGKKGGKKGGGIRDVPKLPMFPEIIPPFMDRGGKSPPMLVDLLGIKKLIMPTTTTNIGYRKRETKNFFKSLLAGGSVRDVICGPNYPLPPKPQPHGGIFGNGEKCGECSSKGGLLKTKYGLLHKKMKKLLQKAFDKAKFVLEYMLEHTLKSMDEYREHFKQMVDEFDPILDALDKEEFDDHKKVEEKVKKLRDMKNELDFLRKELIRLRKEHDQDVKKAIAQRQAEVDELEKQVIALETLLNDMMDALKDWQSQGENKLKGPEEQLKKLKEKLQKIKDSVLVERDNLRKLLEWETKLATEQTVCRMEEIISQDIELIFSNMNPAWFKLFMENEKLEKEYNVLNGENHLLELEVDTLQRQKNKLLQEKKLSEKSKLLKFRPEVNTADLYKKLLPCGVDYRLDLYPSTKYIHE